MFNRCRHQYEEVYRTFNPPRSVRNVKNIDEETLYDLVFGFTNIKLVCKHCGLIKIVSAPGKVDP